METKIEGTSRNTEREEMFKQLLSSVVYKRRTYPSKITQIMKHQLEADRKAIEAMNVQTPDVVPLNLERRVPDFDAKELIQNCSDLLDSFNCKFKQEHDRSHQLNNILINNKAKK